MSGCGLEGELGCITQKVYIVCISQLARQGMSMEHDLGERDGECGGAHQKVFPSVLTLAASVPVLLCSQQMSYTGSRWECSMGEVSICRVDLRESQ